jgi:hypothetical protein
MGNPIQPQPGMTINQTPAQPPAPAAAAAGGPWQPTSLVPQALQAGQNVQDPNRLQTIRQNRIIQDQLDPTQGNLASMYRDQAALARMGAAAGGGQPATPRQGVNAAGLTPQQYMALRANPGPVPTYGATVPQSSGAQPGSGVLQHFLQNWRPAQSGPGSQFQQGFSTALKGLGYQ